MAARLSVPRVVLAATTILVSAASFFPSAGAQTPPALSAAPPDLGQMQAHDIATYATAVDQADIANYVAAVQAGEAEAAARAARPAPSTGNPGPGYSGPASTGQCGGATNGADQYIMRESGGNPSVANPSGAYGCYQIMPSTWAGSCSDLGSEQGSSAATQAQCASRLPDSAWAL